MMKRKILAAVIPALLVAGAANAAEIYNKNGNKLDFYGKMVGEHVWTTNGDTSSDDTTYARIGLKGETQINDQLVGYGQWEYNMDASNVEGKQTTKTRLAFAGLKPVNTVHSTTAVTTVPSMTLKLQPICWLSGAATAGTTPTTS
jgi:outer membrane pore protein F